MYTPQYILGRMYYLGEGTGKDLVKAAKWLDLAAAQGNTKAIKLRDDLLKTTEEQSNSFASLSSVPSKPTDKIAATRNCYDEQRDIEKKIENKRKLIPLWMGLIIVAITAFSMAWNEKRFVSGFAESFIAVALCLGGTISGFVGGYYVGNKVYHKTSQKWLGWIAGIIILFIIIGLINSLAESIPGVNWRFNKFLHD